MNTRRLTLMAVMAAIALTIFIAEMQIPTIVPIPGIKLGLSNIVTLAAIAVLGRREAALILAARIILGSLFSGSMSVLIFSLAGGACALAVMSAVYGALGEKLIWAVSILGALAHNAGQLAAAVVVLRSASIFFYAPLLVVSAIITGLFTGLCSRLLIQAVRRFPLS